MKKTACLIAGALALSSALNAQVTTTTTTTTTRTTSNKFASIQIRAGANFTNLNGESGGDDLNNKIKVGYHAGLEIPMMIAPEFYLQPGVLYTRKGAVDENNSDNKITLSYIEIPVNFVYKPMLGTGSLMLGVGPYMGIAIDGKDEVDDVESDINFENDITALQDATGNYLRRLDFGGNLLVGYQFGNNLLFQVNAQLGMTNLLPDIDGQSPPSGNKVKNTGFGVSLGYIF